MRELGMTADEIAAATGLNACTVRRMVKRGELPRLRGTARVIVPTIAVERWIEESINGNGPQQFASAGGPAQTTEGTRDAEQPRP